MFQSVTANKQIQYLLGEVSSLLVCSAVSVGKELQMFR